ncbi:alpha/beta hydrolase [Bacillus alkalicellulosilyticus]|uniref:alpha/beta hydrolase n=1 Tax=Alkalihalobacterium alkalicellulosilyticum TaxID=1912214 RepID=UPI000996BE78|nr:alpha/beta hydrolase [Bacillus alkalicellulosilyticus]
MLVKVKPRKKALSIVRNSCLFVVFLLLTFNIVVFLSVQQWSTTAEGKLPPKTAVVLHAVNKNLVTPDIKRPSFLAGPGVSSIRREDISIPVRDGSSIKGRMYKPIGEGPFPVIMYYHGGAFLEGYGNIDTHDNIARALAVRTKSIVILVGYRLAPTYVFPTAIEDSYDSLVWAYEQAETFQGDNKKMAVVGDSAGGNIATAVAIMTRDYNGPPLSAQVLYYPLTTFHDMALPSRERYDSGYYLLSRRVMTLARDRYIPEESMWSSPYSSPLNANVSDLPPTFIITAEFDPLRDEGEAYAEHLAQHGVPVKAYRYNGVMHGFISFFEVMETGKHGLAQTSIFLRDQFKEEQQINDGTYELKVFDGANQKLKEQVEAYVIASFLLGKQVTTIFPLRY